MTSATEGSQDMASDWVVGCCSDYTPSVVRPPAFFSERGRRRLVTGGATLSASAKSVLMKLMGFPAHDADLQSFDYHLPRRDKLTVQISKSYRLFILLP